MWCAFRRVVVLSLGTVLLLDAPIAAQMKEAVFSGQHLPLGPPGAYMEDRKVLLADVDLDGVPDLVNAALPFITSSTESLFITPVQPKGGLGKTHVWPLNAASTYDIAIGLLESDPWPDVAVCTYNSRVVILRGMGNGNFKVPAQYVVAGGELNGLELIDVDANGELDLLTCSHTSNQLNLNLADGTGGFLATQSWPTGHAAWDLAAGDLSGDGWADALTSDLFGDTVSMNLGDGQGGFLPPQLMTCQPYPVQLDIARLDGDAYPDLLVVGKCCVQAWINDGTGGLQPGLVSYPAITTKAATLHDLDDDGDLDVVTANAGSRDVTLLFNNGAGKFQMIPSIPSGTGSAYPIVIDATGDGVRDVLLHVQAEAEVLLPAMADGTFTVPATYSTEPMVNVRRAEPAFLDGDKWPDLLCRRDFSGELFTLLGGPHGFELPALPVSGQGGTADVRVGDLTGDGRADVVTAHISLLRVGVGAGLGDGSFAAPLVATWDGTSTAGDSLELADLNDDGLLDALVRTEGADSSVVTLVNDPLLPGQLRTGLPLPTLSDAVSLAVGDLDADGAPDAVTLHRSASGQPAQLAVLRGVGDGGLLPPLASALPAWIGPADSVGLGDVDLDGLLDAVVVFEDQAIALARGDGSGKLLAAGIQLPVPGGGGVDYWATAPAIGDVDGDGWPDILHGGRFNGNRLVLRRGDGAGGQLPPEFYAAFGSHQSIRLFDMTLDGQPDLVLGSGDDLPYTGGGHARVFENLVKQFTWIDLGHAHAGVYEPRLTGTGALKYGTPGRLLVSGGQPSQLAVLFVAPWEHPTPFKGGLLVAVPPLLAQIISTDALGRSEVPWAAFPSDNPGAAWAFQVAVSDSASFYGFALTNAVRGTEPIDN